ncbi:hypothetical protein MD484_g8663, partial [Candolleomyces efflorescens]
MVDNPRRSTRLAKTTERPAADTRGDTKLPSILKNTQALEKAATTENNTNNNVNTHSYGKNTSTSRLVPYVLVPPLPVSYAAAARKNIPGKVASKVAAPSHQAVASDQGKNVKASGAGHKADAEKGTRANQRQGDRPNGTVNVIGGFHIKTSESSKKAQKCVPAMPAPALSAGESSEDEESSNISPPPPSQPRGTQQLHATHDPVRGKNARPVARKLQATSSDVFNVSGSASSRGMFSIKSNVARQSASGRNENSPLDGKVAPRLVSSQRGPLKPLTKQKAPPEVNSTSTASSRAPLFAAPSDSPVIDPTFPTMPPFTLDTVPTYQLHSFRIAGPDQLPKTSKPVIFQVGRKVSMVGAPTVERFCGEGRIRSRSSGLSGSIIEQHVSFFNPSTLTWWKLPNTYFIPEAESAKSVLKGTRLDAEQEFLSVWLARVRTCHGIEDVPSACNWARAWANPRWKANPPVPSLHRSMSIAHSDSVGRTLDNRTHLSPAGSPVDPCSTPSGSDWSKTQDLKRKYKRHSSPSSSSDSPSPSPDYQSKKARRRAPTPSSDVEDMDVDGGSDQEGTMEETSPAVEIVKRGRRRGRQHPSSLPEVYHVSSGEEEDIVMADGSNVSGPAVNIEEGGSDELEERPVAGPSTRRADKGKGVAVDQEDYAKWSVEHDEAAAVAVDTLTRLQQETGLTWHQIFAKFGVSITFSRRNPFSVFERVLALKKPGVPLEAFGKYASQEWEKIGFQSLSKRQQDALVEGWMEKIQNENGEVSINEQNRDFVRFFNQVLSNLQDLTTNVRQFGPIEIVSLIFTPHPQARQLSTIVAGDPNFRSILARQPDSTRSLIEKFIHLAE